MSMEQVVKCKICGKPYIFMPFYAGQQDACPSCVKQAQENTFPKSLPGVQRWAAKS